MFATIGIGLGMGMAAGLHCIGMCGPLALSFPFYGDGKYHRIRTIFLYNGGRVVTYLSLGMLAGMLGRAVQITGYQQWLSIITGTVLLLWVLGEKYLAVNGPMAFFQRWIKKQLFRFLPKAGRPGFPFIVGLLNGLLPCGMVYMAIASALVLGSPLQSGLLMVAFGLGTVPLMGLLMLTRDKLSFPIRRQLKKALPWFTALVACLLILRGLNLGIPYVSPAFVNTQNAATISCPP